MSPGDAFKKYLMVAADKVKADLNADEAELEILKSQK